MFSLPVKAKPTTNLRRSRDLHSNKGNYIYYLRYVRLFRQLGIELRLSEV
jgi:hypothetical protein